MSTTMQTNHPVTPSEKIQILFKYWWHAKDIQNFCGVTQTIAYNIKKKLKEANDENMNKYNGDQIKRDAVLEAYLNSSYEQELSALLHQVEVLKKLSNGVGPDA